MLTDYCLRLYSGIAYDEADNPWQGQKHLILIEETPKAGQRLQMRVYRDQGNPVSFRGELVRRLDRSEKASIVSFRGSHNYQPMNFKCWTESQRPSPRVGLRTALFDCFYRVAMSELRYGDTELEAKVVPITHGMSGPLKRPIQGLKISIRSGWRVNIFDYYMISNAALGLETEPPKSVGIFHEAQDEHGSATWYSLKEEELRPIYFIQLFTDVWNLATAYSGR